MKKTLLLIISAFFAVSLIAQTVNEKPGIDLQKLKSLENTKGLLATSQRLDSTISELTSNGGTTYTFSNRKRYSYSTVALTTTTITTTSTSPKNWNSVWINSNKTENTVNGSGKPVLNVAYSWNGIAWVGSVKTEYVYTGANLTQTTTSTWNTGLNQWVGIARTDFTYTGINIATEIHSTWNGSAWVLSTRVVNTYTAGVLTSDITSEWNGASWDNTDMTEFLYTGVNVATITFKIWDVGSSSFINDSKIDYTYPTGKTLGILSNWIAGTPGAWDAAGKYEYTYDVSARLTQFIMSSSTDNGTTWTGVLRTDTSYGTQGALTYAITTGFSWDAIGSQFVAQTRATSWYSDVTTGIEQVSEKTLKVYPNPAKDFVIFKLADISESASVIIFDMQGKKVLEQKLSGNRQLDIYKLPKGMYIYKFFNKGINYSGKLLKN